jgi:hypothetical protein
MQGEFWSVRTHLIEPTTTFELDYQELYWFNRHAPRRKVANAANVILVTASYMHDKEMRPKKIEVKSGTRNRGPAM